MTLNASNFSRNLHVNRVTADVEMPPFAGNRKARRKAFALLRQKQTTGTLDRLNEAQSDRVLHPTKGWRKINPKRTVASTIVDMNRKGFLGSLQDIKEAFANA